MLFSFHEELRALTDVELLEHFFGPEAFALLNRHGSLAALFHHDNMADERYHSLFLARELIVRAFRQTLLTERECYDSPDRIREYLRLHFAGRQAEAFVAMWLDAHHALIAIDELFAGTLTQTSVYPREVAKRALQRNAAAVIFSHNHPSGSSEPSTADELLTRALKSALALLDVRVLDHFVVPEYGVPVSFAERGLL